MNTVSSILTNQRPVLHSLANQRPGHFLVGHLLAQPATQAPNTLAENPGHTAIQASSSSPGHWPLESPLLLLLTLLLLLLPDKALGVWNSFLAGAFWGVLLMLLLLLL